MVLSSFSLAGKVALVTGCRRGIGQAIAEALAEAGADIIGVSASLELTGSAVAQAVEARGRRFFAYQADFGKRDELTKFIQTVQAAHPVVDILVNNAGTTYREPAANHRDEYWDEVIAINQTAPFILTREFGRAMLTRGYGKVIFTASLMTFQGGITVPGYAASKGAIGSLVKAFANEWAGQGVNVNAIAPGYISTDLTEALRLDTNRNQSILSRIPANRWGEPADFKGPVVFLASDASSYVHGTVLTVDGGWMGR